MSNIYSKITDLKHELSGLEIKKSGHNKHLGFRYHELGDFLGVISELNKKYGISELVSITESAATLTLTNVEEPSDFHIVSVPYVMATMQPKNDAIQKLGATLTYLRRYLYVQAYAITEHDVVDALNIKDKPVVDNELQAKRFYQHVLSKASDDAQAQELAKSFLETVVGVSSLRDIDFEEFSLKELIVTFNEFVNREKDGK